MAIFVAFPCLAQKGLTVLANVKNGRLFVESQFDNGNRPNAAKIMIWDDRSVQILKEDRTDSEGKYAYELPYITDLRVRVDAGVGYYGEVVIREKAVKESLNSDRIGKEINVLIGVKEQETKVIDLAAADSQGAAQEDAAAAPGRIKWFSIRPPVTAAERMEGVNKHLDSIEKAPLRAVLVEVLKWILAAAVIAGAAFVYLRNNRKRQR